MTDVFVLRDFEPALQPGEVYRLAASTGGCYALHQVHWRESLLALDGHRMCCHFTAPDAESARLALRASGSPAFTLWHGSVHLSPQAAASANVVVERIFDTPVDPTALQQQEDEYLWCLQTHQVQFQRTFLSADRLRMCCLYAAPDAEAVRQAQRKAGMPVHAIWGYQLLRP